MKIIFTALLLIAVCLNVSAFSVKGKVVNSEGIPQEYATFRIFSIRDSVKPVAYGVTDENGLFNKKLSSAGKYVARVSVVGLKEWRGDFELTAVNPDVNLDSIKCEDAANLLGEVTVTATKPLVIKEIDRIGYDVQSDEESQTSNVSDMLKKVPLVSVDADGTIRVKGSSDFKIYKNGKPNNSFTSNAKEIFKALPASMIKKIEVITDPGAREDAEGSGAILNIVTVQGSSIKGMMANVGLSYNTRSNVPTPNIWGSAQVDKVTFSAYGGAFFNPRRSSKSRSVTEGIYEESGNKMLSTEESRSNTKGGYWGLEASWEPDTMNLFTLELGGFAMSNKSHSFGLQQLTDAADKLIYKYNTEASVSPWSYFDLNGGFNYQHNTHRKGENITLSYLISTNRQRSNSQNHYSNMENMPVDYTGVYSDSKLNFTEQTFQFNWTRILAEVLTLDLGTKYIYRNNSSKNNQTYFGTDRNPLTDFSHRTHIAAAFADGRLKFNRVGLRAGVRYEFSRLSAKFNDGSQAPFGSNLNDVVPNAAVSYNINDQNTIKLSYNTHINRPGIDYLNPAISESPNSTSQGNPDLGSSRSNDINFNYSLVSRKLTLDITAGYTFTNNAIISIMDVQGNHTYSNYANAGHNKAFNTSVFMQWMMTPKTSVMCNLNAEYNHYANKSLNITNSGWSGYGYMRISQKLPWKLTCNLGAFSYLGSVSMYSITRPMGVAARNWNISLQRNFLKEERLSVRLSLSNPITTAHPKMQTKSYNTSYKTIATAWQPTRRMFMIGISYRFGKMSGYVKKTAKSISNDDLQNQSKQSGGGQSGEVMGN